MYGYHGRIVTIDLTHGECKVEPFGEDFARAYLGGNGFAARILFDRIPPGADPLSPDNVVVFAVGPITDTTVPGCSRAYAAFKSPMTGLYFDSTFGGRFALTQKRTGYDAMVITGQAAQPVYVLVEDGAAKVLPADDLWGRSIDSTSTVLRKRHGEESDCAAIGPAGEKQVRYACMGHYWKGREGIAGRGGLGAVLGSKRVKAVLVKGTRKTEVADPSGLSTLVSRKRETLKQGTAAFSEFGTAVLVEPVNALGGLGTRNLQRETCDQATAISGETFKDRYFDKHITCAKCPVACGKISRVQEGPYAPSSWKTPEFESIYSLGTMLEVCDPAAILAANRLCDELGVDTISMGVTLAFALECFERGLIAEADSGMPLRFGDADAVLELIRWAARRQGIGDLLAEGSVRMAARLGPEATQLLYAVKGLEIAGHSARILKGMSIGYATATRGGSHHDTRPTRQYSPEQDNRSAEGQPQFAMDSQHFTTVGDSLTQCRFVSERGFGAGLNSDYAAMINAVTGWEQTVDDVVRVGERIYNLERAFNVREGVRRADDTLPHRVMNEPVPDGSHQGMHCAREELDGMLDEYYRLRGWSDRGIPTRAKLEELGLDDVAENLWG